MKETLSLINIDAVGPDIQTNNTLAPHRPTPESTSSPSHLPHDS
ncbi:hypothetical protein [Halorubrum sp. AJ67]|nr:hypothetical protein [Halorubrum sp. AJ67]